MKFNTSISLFLSALVATNAFTVQRSTPLTSHAIRPLVAARAATNPTTRQSTARWMAEDNEESVETRASSEEPVAQQESGAEGSEEKAAGEEPEQPKEDAEVLAIKKEIAKLESTLKEKRRELAYVSDKADEYTKSGYARKVAEMENMRRARSMLASSNKSGAMAGVLASFLPVLEKLTDLQGKYGEDDFGKSYNALPSTMRQVFTDLGAVEYTVTTGDVINKSRMDAVQTEYSAEFATNTVIRPIAMGWELQGNVIRPAQCVVSLGPEPAKEETGTDKKEESAEPLE